MHLKSKILLIGASSFLGRALIREFDRFSVVPTYYKTKIQSGYQFELEKDDPETLLNEVGSVHWAILLASIASPDACVKDPKRSRLINVEATRRLIDCCIERSITPVFASSEAVFSGEKGNYQESDLPAPILEYGRQKREIEEYLMSQSHPYLILRIARVYDSRPESKSILNDLLKMILLNTELRVASDQIMSPLHTDDFSLAFRKLLEQNASGIYHFGGPQQLSRFEMCEALLMSYTRYRSFTGKLIPTPLADFDVLETRPQDLSLDSSKLRNATNVNFRTIKRSCEELIDRLYHSEGTEKTNRPKV